MEGRAGGRNYLQVVENADFRRDCTCRAAGEDKHLVGHSVHHRDHRESLQLEVGGHRSNGEKVLQGAIVRSICCQETAVGRSGPLEKGRDNWKSSMYDK